MATKNTTQVLIGGKIYTMSGYESEDYLQRVAGYLNNKITEIKAAEGYTRMSQEMRSLLLNLNTADDYFKLKEKSDQLSESLSSKDKELYEIKHELISTQMKLENVTRDLAVAKDEYQEAMRELTQLRTRLQDVQAGLSMAPSEDKKRRRADHARTDVQPDEKVEEPEKKPAGSLNNLEDLKETIVSPGTEKEDTAGAQEQGAEKEDTAGAQEQGAEKEDTAGVQEQGTEKEETADAQQQDTVIADRAEEETAGIVKESAADEKAQGAGGAEPSLESVINEIAMEAQPQPRAKEAGAPPKSRKKYNRYYRN